MALVGMGSVILDGTTISKKVIIGAKSLVPSGKTLESGYLYMGSPCKKIRPLKDTELEFLKYSATHYVNTKNDFLSQS
jgi:carbonic anhydrase/acetyltransferase-like protein (isoleucine patch superfamily)